jgi:UDP-glucose 4-epimerase
VLEGHRILITGGAGFIGSHLAERLIGTNEITIFDNYHRDALSASRIGNDPSLTRIEGDILDGEAVRRALKGNDIVFHCAAIAGIDTVGRRPVTTLKVNVLGSLNVLEAAADQDEIHRVVCFSTSEVFGRDASGVTEEDDARIGPPGEPRWTYAAGKLAEEQFAAAFFIEHGLPTTVVRPFNVYGPRQVGEGAIRNFILEALSGRPLVIRGDGSAVRAWTYIDDMVSGACLAAAIPEASGDYFNIGDPREPVSVNELAEQIVRLVGTDIEIFHAPAAGPDVNSRIPDIEKARRVLGFEPLVNLQDGIEATISHFRDPT